MSQARPTTIRADSYDVLMVDPPWPVAGYANVQRGSPGRVRGVGYTTLPWSDLWTLLDADVFSRAAGHCAVFLWALDQFLIETEVELTARGFKRSARLLWDKHDGPITYRLRRTHEYLLWYCRPRLLPASKTSIGRFDSVIRAPQRQHSRKPSAAYTMVEALYPDARRLDAFSREYRVGWDAWGDQRDYFSPLFACLRDAP